MATPIGDKKQELNFSYLQVVAATAGFAFGRNTQDFGIDGHFRQIGQMPNGNYYAKTQTLNFQAKATENATRLQNGTQISYTMEVEYYNKLAYMNKDNSSPCLLVVLALPKGMSEWAAFDEDIMQLSGCCYWEIIRQETQNIGNVAVRIPRSNQFNPEALVNLYQAMLDGNL